MWGDLSFKPDWRRLCHDLSHFRKRVVQVTGSAKVFGEVRSQIRETNPHTRRLSFSDGHEPATVFTSRSAVYTSQLYFLYSFHHGQARKPNLL